MGGEAADTARETSSIERSAETNPKTTAGPPGKSYSSRSRSAVSSARERYAVLMSAPPTGAPSPSKGTCALAGVSLGVSRDVSGFALIRSARDTSDSSFFFPKKPNIFTSSLSLCFPYYITSASAVQNAIDKHRYDEHRYAEIECGTQLGRKDHEHETEHLCPNAEECHIGEQRHTVAQQ